jgi:hypothetical protein
MHKGAEINCDSVPFLPLLYFLQSRDQLLCQTFFRFRPEQARTCATVFLHVHREFDQLCHVVANLGASLIAEPGFRVQKIRIQPKSISM